MEQAFKGKEQAHVETIDGTEAHWDQPANSRVFRARYSMPSTRYSMRAEA